MKRIFRTPEYKKSELSEAAFVFTPRLVYDFEFCAGKEELDRLIYHINLSGYALVGVTQDLSGIYTVFFRRPTDG